MKLNYILLITSFLMIGSSFTQMSTLEQKGNKYFEVFNYGNAIIKYEETGVDNLTTGGLRKLAIANRKIHKTVQSEAYYALLVNKSDSKAEDMYQYAEVLLMNNKMTEADDWMKKYHERVKSDGRAADYVKKNGSFQSFKKDNGRYTIYTLEEINTPQEDFSPAYYRNQIVFTSARNNSNPIKRKWNWNNQPYLNLYYADIVDEYKLEDADKLSKKINKKYHEGPASFSEDGDLMVFTRNNYQAKASDRARNLTLHYREKNDKGKWGKIKDFSFNNQEYSVGHPALSANGKVLYFASDMPGGKGATDIYRIERTGDNWSAPVNAGETINTEGREMFPFFHEDGLLFFASDGQVGLGGLDVFVAATDKNTNSYKNVKNIGYPLNTNHDDFGFILDSNQFRGYFSSNRPGGKGSDDIYSFILNKKFKSCKEIKGFALDKKGNALAKTKVNLINSDEVIETVITGEKGDYMFCVAPGDYKLEGTKAKHFPGFNKASIKEETEDAVQSNVILEQDPGFSLLANVKDAKSKGNISGAKVLFTNNLVKTTNEAVTNLDGNAGEPIKGVALNEAVSYSVTVEKEGYLPKTVPFNKKLVQPGVQNLAIELEKIPSFSLYALITDKKTGKPLEGVTVTLVNNSTNKKEIISLPASADFTRGIKGKKLNDNISYGFTVKKEGYLTKELTYNKKLTREGRYNAHLDLDFGLNPIEVGGDLSKLIEINPIYFDLNKSNIRPDAALELDKIVKVMNEYPGMEIELGSHTDCRASKKYNEALSDRRAKSSAAYIASRITKPERIQGKGYGEEKILNKCLCEGKVKVPCTNAEHDINRRTEFRITKFDVKGVKAKANGPKSFDK